MNLRSRDNRTPLHRVLVADDHTSLRQLWAQMLRLHDMAADEAADGNEALDLIAQHHYDAILCDLHMPGLDGRALFDACQARYPEAASRIIFVTGRWYADADEMCAGTNRPCLFKGFSWGQLHAVLQSVFDSGDASTPPETPPAPTPPA